MHKRGDTLIEVMFAVGLFGLVAIGAISLMNQGLSSAQSTLETTMARQEIDAQAETLRFLRDAYMSEVDSAGSAITNVDCSNISSYGQLWKCITKKAYTADKVIQDDPDFYKRVAEPGVSCDKLFRLEGTTSFSILNNSFVVNPRALNSAENLKTALAVNSTQSIFRPTATYPRLIYSDVNEALSDAEIGNDNRVSTKDYSSLSWAEGIWVTAIESEDRHTVEGGTTQPDYYDFRIQTCWDSLANNSSAAIASTIRLFNPDGTKTEDPEPEPETPEEPEEVESGGGAIALYNPQYQNSGIVIDGYHIGVAHGMDCSSGNFGTYPAMSRTGYTCMGSLFNPPDGVERSVIASTFPFVEGVNDFIVFTSIQTGGGYYPDAGQGSFYLLDVEFPDELIPPRVWTEDEYYKDRASNSFRSELANSGVLVEITMSDDTTTVDETFDMTGARRHYWIVGKVHRVSKKRYTITPINVLTGRDPSEFL